MPPLPFSPVGFSAEMERVRALVIRGRAPRPIFNPVKLSTVTDPNSAVVSESDGTLLRNGNLPFVSAKGTRPLFPPFPRGDSEGFRRGCTVPGGSFAPVTGEMPEGHRGHPRHPRRINSPRRTNRPRAQASGVGVGEAVPIGVDVGVGVTVGIGVGVGNCSHMLMPSSWIM